MWEQDIHQAVASIRQDVINWRRYLHQHPELSGQEANTAAFVAEKLQAFGVTDIQTGVGGTHAVTGLIQGTGTKVVALRADMDALPITERHESPYCSQTPGVMHACGHDAHTAILLGAAQVLTCLRDQLPGQVKLIFQPAEERIDCDGAKKLVETGVLKSPDVSAIFGLHVFPELNVGEVGLRFGALMASSDVFHITIKGKSTHASRPHLGVDPVIIAAQVINSLHHIVSRKIDPMHPAVLTIGKIEGGTAENIIPDEVRLGGTVRTLDQSLRQDIPKWIERTLLGITSAYGGAYTFDYTEGTAPVINHEDTTQIAQQTLQQLWGENLIQLEYPSMGGEDFGEYMLEIPGTFLRLGVRNESKGIKAPLHSSYFDLDEDCLSVGVTSLSAMAFNWLAGQAGQ